MERVLITGLGLASRVGDTIDAYWEGLLSARAQPIEVADPYARMDNRLHYSAPGPVAEPPPAAGTRLGRGSALALGAARRALCDAGLGDVAAGTGEVDIGLMVGTAVGDATLLEDARSGTVPRVAGADAFAFKVCSVLAEEFRLTGPTLSVATACSASAYSVSLAVDAIRAGTVDAVIAGGTDSYTRVAQACFNRMDGLDPVRCRPFDAGRRGTVLGEGAAMLILESESHARRRGHEGAYATVEGAGWSCDGYHITAPDPAGSHIARAMRAALRDAGLRPDAIDCLIPHGTGTPLNDEVESRSVVAVFGPAAATLATYSLKAMLGHTAGASGAFALLTAALILHRGVMPPNVPVESPDPACPLPLHTGALLRREFHRALVNAYAFGGNNVSLVLGRA